MKKKHGFLPLPREEPNVVAVVASTLEEDLEKLRALEQEHERFAKENENINVLEVEGEVVGDFSHW